ncbi:thioesterase family protein [Actinoplanes sp. NPDC026619]|uniref:thioesterase family protein n=1 Tax=Actinoplanes sp. NPDC026619 TaxID=3155798 RepID=UPI0034040375
MKSFAEATAVSGANGTYEAELDPQWAVGDKMHGGYLMAVLCRAVGAAAEHPHLVAVTTSFLRPPVAGRATVVVELLRAGRGSAQYRARLEQDGTPCAEALVTQGTLDESDAWWSGVTPPELPAEDDCVLLPSNPPGAQFPVHLLDVVEHRLSPADLGFAIGQPSTTGRTASWLRLAGGADWDPLSLLIALDPVPPISLTMGVTGWAPTITLTAYLRRLPAPGPVRVAMHANEITAGRMDEIAFVWDAKDNLVAQATQLAAIRH